MLPREEMEFLQDQGDGANQQLDFFDVIYAGGSNITPDYKRLNSEIILVSTITLVEQHITLAGKTAREVLSN